MVIALGGEARTLGKSRGSLIRKDFQEQNAATFSSPANAVRNQIRTLSEAWCFLFFLFFKMQE